MEDRFIRFAGVWLLPTVIVMGGAIAGPRSHDALAYATDVVCVLVALVIHDVLRDLEREIAD